MATVKGEQVMKNSIVPNELSFNQCLRLKKRIKKTTKVNKENKKAPSILPKFLS